jgi:NlpC/P60 family putative phage cell wall peptidase
MTVARADVVACARTWLGTRWQHQGRLKGVGVDCAGLIMGVGYELALFDVRFTNYSRHPDGETLMALCREHLRRIDPSQAAPGDVLVFAWTREPQHMGFASEVAGRPGLIHAFADARRVVEHDFDDSWRGRLRGAFHVPGVE